MASSSSVRTTVHESLPYIDRDPTEAEREAAQALITAELSSTSPSTTPSTSTSSPPSLPPLREPNFSPLILSELSRISAGEAIQGIDLSRYEIQDSPSSSSSPESLITPLQRAYTTLTYLEQRQTNLHLLNSYGKNAWLVSNWQTESSLLASLERDLAAARTEIDLVNLQRRRLQVDDNDTGGGAGVAEELRGLEEAWKKGVGRVLETEIATENLRQKILELERQRVAAA